MATPSPCDGQAYCRGNYGNDLFWNYGLPLVLVSLLISHELWRRICPLSFASQLFRALGMQRTVVSGKGKPRLVSVEPNSWLGRHHVQLQWTVLLSGLSLRLLVANSSALVLALLCLSALVGALVVGWAYEGKSWCQFFCPLGPVQTVFTGPRSLMGSPAHVGTTTRTTQSMCRTVSPEGKDVSACVACITPCIDIDSERRYWKDLSGQRGLDWAWYSYPGVVLAFYLLILATSPEPGLRGAYDYLHSGAFAYDGRLQGLVLEPMLSIGSVSIPRLVVIPAALAGAAWLSARWFTGLERLLARRLGDGDPQRRNPIAVHHSRLIATVVAINLFFFFKSNVFSFAGMAGERLLEFTVAAITSAWLLRGWRRDESTYRRESTSESLRRQLARLPDLEMALDGRRLDDLSPLEVFTLAKALPSLGLQRARQIYRGVMEDLLRTGRISRAESLLQLQALRNSLKLEDQDHHVVVRQLAEEEPHLLEIDGLQRQREELTEQVARESLHELMAVAGVEVLILEGFSGAQRQRLEQLRQSCGLDDERWQALLISLGPHGDLEGARLRERCAQLSHARGLQILLEREAADDGLLQPLSHALAIRNRSLGEQLEARLQAAALPVPAENPRAAGSLQEALDLLWHDPDPDTAAWVLMVERLRFPGRAAARVNDPRIGMESSQFLEDIRAGRATEDIGELPILATCELFTDLPPAGLLQVAAEGELRRWQPGEVIFRAGDACDGLGVVIQGEVVVVKSPGGERIPIGPGKIFGEMAVITERRRSADVETGNGGVEVFWLPAESFQLLLIESRGFTHSVMLQLVERIHQGRDGGEPSTDSLQHLARC